MTGRIAKRALARLAIEAAFFLALAGCSLVPDYERPEVAIPPDWKTQLATATPVDWPSRDWWRGYGSPSLDKLIATAQSNNTDIGAAAARVLQADAQARIAGAPLVPGVELAASADRQWNWSTAAASSKASDFATSLATSYELDLFGRNRAALLAAEVSVLRSRFDRDTVAIAVTADVATSYFQLLQLRDRLTVARRNLTIAQDILRIVEARVDAGAASPLELAQQRTAVANQRAAIPPLETQLRQTETALAILLGETPGSLEGVGGALTAIDPPSIDPGLPSGLLIRRPDVQAAEAALIAANADIGAARAAFFPSLDLSLRGSLGAPLVGTVFDPVGTSVNVAAGLVQTIFDGGRIAGQVDLAEGRKLELIEGYRQAVISAFGDVEDALIALDRSGAEETLRIQALEQARLAYQLAETRYRAGAEDLLTVLDAQRSLYQAEDAVVQTRAGRLQASVALYRALGGGWERDSSAG
ncbi:MAG: efflux transporter outer membrane subunit [Kiloniellales bacterium]